MAILNTLETRFVDAVQAEKLDVVRDLLEMADINPEVVRDSLKHVRTSVELAAYLISKGADIKTPDLLREIMLTCTPQLMAFFIAKGSLLTVTKGAKSHNLMGLLLRDGDHCEKLELLLENSAPFPLTNGDEYSIDRFRDTPLYCALLWRRERSFELVYQARHSILRDVGLLVFDGVLRDTTTWRSEQRRELGSYLRFMLLSGVTYHNWHAWGTCFETFGFDIHDQWSCDSIRRIACDLSRQQRQELTEKNRVAEFEKKIAQRAHHKSLQHEEKQQEASRVQTTKESQLELKYERIALISICSFFFMSSFFSLIF